MERGRLDENEFKDLNYGRAFVGNYSVLVRMPDDPVDDDKLYLHHDGANFTLYQVSQKGIKILVNTIDGVTTALSNYPIKENRYGGLYVDHPSIQDDLTPSQAQELFIKG
uniref:hypothetical protein n=1 Tax=Lentilactobacillus hilgardii TaxID=1588 RepID=UPI00403FA968